MEKHDVAGDPILIRRELLHVLRHPYGRDEWDRRRDRLQAADEIERLENEVKDFHEPGYKRDVFGNLKLLVESDLSFFSFSSAWDILSRYVCNVEGIRDDAVRYSLVVNIAAYHTAFRLALAADMNVEITQKLDEDEWALNAEWFDPKTSKACFERVWSAGA